MVVKLIDWIKYKVGKILRLFEVVMFLYFLYVRFVRVDEWFCKNKCNVKGNKLLEVVFLKLINKILLERVNCWFLSFCLKIFIFKSCIV